MMTGKIRDPRESTAHTEARLLAALRLLRVMWPIMFHRPSVPVRRQSPRALILHDDASEATDDLAHIDVVMSLRYDTTKLLESWAVLLVEDRRLGHRLPVDWDTIGLVNLLERHARWLAGHDAATDLVREVEEAANRCTAIAFPIRRDDMRIGWCTGTLGVDGRSTLCGTEIRVNARYPGDIRCPRCGLTDTLDGWIARIVGEAALVTAEQLVPLLHKRLGVLVSTVTIRKWVQRGDLHIEGTDEHGRNLYDRHAAFLVIKRREARALV
jgi:hypothetical protein